MSTQGEHPYKIPHKKYALPVEHGSWIWWIGPFLIGLAAGGHVNLDLGILFITALAAFLLRQPTTMVVKALSGRRPKSDLAPALLWMMFYTLMTLSATVFLVSKGYPQLLLIAIPAIPVFVLHLWFVSQRAERGRMGIELFGSGVLALTAPAAYWLSGGLDSVEAWILWGITWLQSASSIAFVYLRLAQRRLSNAPPGIERWRMGARTLFYNSFNLGLSILLAAFNLVPLGIPIAFAFQLFDVLEGILRPPIGAKPTSIGFRQLGSSTLFVMIVMISYLI